MEILAKIYLSKCEHSYGECYDLYDLEKDGTPNKNYSQIISGTNPVSLNQKVEDIHTTSFDINKIAIYHNDEWIRLDILLNKLLEN
ncbi:MAG: hypothetical protein ACFFG0_02650 [Candidatus Thorarchaeota archaeon]